MEDYKKKYEEALENFKKIRNANGNNKELVDFIEYNYPALKESEDERIRKEILEYFHQFENEELRRVNISDWLAWLEKQDPKKHEEELEKAYKTADEVQYKKGYEDAKREFEKQGEQKPADKIEPKFKVDDIITNKKSKDTVKIVQILHDSYCYSGWDGAATVHSDFRISEQDNWELVEHKPAWSEEDEKMLNYTISTVKLHLNDVGSDKKEILLVKEEIDWLKSLKEKMKENVH